MEGMRHRRENDRLGVGGREVEGRRSDGAVDGRRGRVGRDRGG